jgi:GNAT superfamily N-acetyltransferase
MAGEYVDPGGSGERSADVRLELASGRSDPRIAEAVALGDAASATLGLLARPIYLDYADRKGLLLAVGANGSVIGYALFNLTARQVRLVHLCVHPASRGHGIAHQMVDWISVQHRDRPGILAWCRLDYNLGSVWSALGFQRLDERPGRGRQPKVLVAWWRDHGHPALFSTARPGVRVRASVDINIVRDFAEPERTDRTESLALQSDQLVDLLELVRTPALDVEIDAMGDNLRGRCSREATNLTAVAPPAERRRTVERSVQLVAAQRDAEFAADPRSKLDMRYVSEAIAAGLNVLVSRDQRLSAVLGEFAADHGLRILRPAEVFVRIDELSRAEAYRPGPIQSTSFTRRLLRAGEETRIDAFGGQRGERAAALRALVRRLTVGGAERVAIMDAAQNIAAVFFMRVEGLVLHVALLRARDGNLAATLVRQILFALRAEAVQRGASIVLLEDPHLGQATIAAAAEDGFVPSPHGHAALVIDTAGDARTVTTAALSAADAGGLPRPASLRPNLPALAAAEVERAWWPAKVLDSQLPTILVPIQQAFSSELLAAPLGLFSRPPELGLSREHVYYRSPRGARISAPARLLWYMSGSARGSVEPSGVVAASLLEEVVVDTPASLHERFRHLGVWRLDQIEGAAADGRAQALRFTYTERFDRSVPSATVRRVVGSPPQGPRRINSNQFQAIYQEARRRG